MFSFGDLFLMWMVMASVQLAATMSPGPAFVVSVRNAMAYSRRIGIYTALGLALGVSVHVVFVLVGLAVVITKSLFLYNLIKYAGAAYLIYIGVRAVIYGGKPASVDGGDGAEEDALARFTAKNAVLNGFITNVLNPKAVVFFTAVFTQFISPDTPFFMMVLFGLTSILIEFLWFSGVAFVLTHERVKRRFMRFMSKVERTCGGLMIALGVKLALLK